MQTILLNCIFRNERYIWTFDMNYNVKKYKGDLGINTNTFKVNVTNYQNAPKEM